MSASPQTDIPEGQALPDEATLPHGEEAPGVAQRPEAPVLGVSPPQASRQNGSAPPAYERPVFSAERWRRPAMVRALVGIGGLLLGAWLLALLLGALGFGGLPFA